jgi:hypothetical protein
MRAAGGITIGLIREILSRLKQCCQSCERNCTTAVITIPYALIRYGDV